MSDPQLELTGPAGQVVVYSVRYFDGAEDVRTVHARVDLGSAPTRLQLEFGHAAMRIKLVIATARPVTARLLDGVRLVEEATSQDTGILELSHGDIPPADDLEPPRGLPDVAERTLIKNFLAALPNADTRALVSPLPLANIDWQTLDAYCRAVGEELGQPVAAKPALDGWITWEGSLGARVLAGDVVFERGRCQFKLMAVEGKLVDVEPTSADMPVDWFTGPASIDAYVEQAHVLVEHLFSGNAAAAHAQFSPRYNEDLSVSQVTELSLELQRLFGSAVQSLELKRSWIEPPTAGFGDTKLMLDSVLQLGDGVRCLSQVEFRFPCGADHLGRGHLAAIHVRQAWDSAAPEMTRQVTEALQALTAVDTSAAEFLERFAPAVQTKINRPQVEEFLRVTRQRLGKLSQEPDYDLWTVETGNQVCARGSVPCELDPDLQVEACFADGRLLGLTMSGTRYAASTLDLGEKWPAANQVAQSFWGDLLTGQLSEAHARLANEFQTQLPLERFEQLVGDSQLPAGGPPASIDVDRARWSSRVARSVPVAWTVYAVARWADGSYLPLRCELLDSPQGPVLLDFSAEFEAEFPVADTQAAQQFFEACWQQDVAQLIAAAAPETSQVIDEAVFSAFLSRLQAVVGDVSVPHEMNAQRVYRPGAQLLKVRTQLETKQGSIPVEVEFERGAWRAFRFQDPRLSRFVDHLQSFASLEDAACSFATTWLTGDVATTWQYLVPSLRTPAIEQRLRNWRTDLRASAGILSECIPVESKLRTQQNQVATLVELRFPRGSRQVRLTFEADALTFKIAAIEFVEAAVPAP